MTEQEGYANYSLDGAILCGDNGIGPVAEIGDIHEIMALYFCLHRERYGVNAQARHGALLEALKDVCREFHVIARHAGAYEDCQAICLERRAAIAQEGQDAHA